MSGLYCLVWPETNGDHISHQEEIVEAFNNFFISGGENLQQQKNPKNSLDPLGYLCTI